MSERMDVKPKFQKLQWGEVKPSGWILEQMKRDLNEGYAKHMEQLTDKVNMSNFKNNRVNSIEITAAGMIEDTPRTWWSGEQTAFWLDGLLGMAYLSDDDEAKQLIDRRMNELLQSQDEDGYIGIYQTSSRFKHRKENGEFWTQSRVFVVMLAYYEWTNKLEYLHAVEKAAQLTMQHYGQTVGQSYFSNEEPAGGTGHGLMMVDVMEWLYNLTEKKEYRDFGIWCYQDYCAAEKIRDTDNQLDNLLHFEKPFNWHTPHTVEHLRVSIWVYFMTGDLKYKEASENAYKKIRRYLVPSGACIGDECIKGREPDPSMTYENCAMTELLVSLQSALQKKGQSFFGDMIETLVYNAIQGARLPDGKAINYLSKDNRNRASFKDGHKGKQGYSPTHKQAALCCSTGAIKAMPYYLKGMWLRAAGSHRGLIAALHGPSIVRTEIDNVKVRIEAITDYPFDEFIVYRVNTETALEFTLHIRIPEWSVGVDVKAGDAKVSRHEGYIAIFKKWLGKEEVSVSFEAKVRGIKAADGTLGVKRGALLYALCIPENRQVVRHYELNGLVDFDALPVEDYSEDDILLLDTSKESFGLSVHRTRFNASKTWETPALRLEGQLKLKAGGDKSATLIPFGSTLLRQTTFRSI